MFGPKKKQPNQQNHCFYKPKSTFSIKMYVFPMVLYTFGLARRFQRSADGSRCLQMASEGPDGPRHLQMAPDVSRWLQMFQMVPDISRQLHMIPDGSRASTGP